MADYELMYWSVPFRGQFVRAVLAFAGKTWMEVSDGRIAQVMRGPVADMPVPFMGPPVLTDNKAGFTVSQMPAIVLYLGETLDLLPDTAALRAMTIKVVNDANDVIDEITLDGGREMWTEKKWQDAIPRFRKWMAIWEETGRRNGLSSDGGYLLGGDAPGIADVITDALDHHDGSLRPDCRVARRSGTDDRGAVEEDVRTAVPRPTGAAVPGSLRRGLCGRADRRIHGQVPQQVMRLPNSR